jgi:hypothetical protein
MNILNDSTVSYKAIGLYMQLYLTPWNARPTLKELCEMRKEDESLVLDAIDELVKSGWLRFVPFRKNGKLIGYRFQIFDKKEI